MLKRCKFFSALKLDAFFTFSFQEVLASPLLSQQTVYFALGNGKAIIVHGWNKFSVWSCLKCVKAMRIEAVSLSTFCQTCAADPSSERGRAVVQEGKADVQHCPWCCSPCKQDPFPHGDSLHISQRTQSQAEWFGLPFVVLWLGCPNHSHLNAIKCYSIY